MKTTVGKAGPAPGAYTTINHALETSNKGRKAPTMVIGTAQRKLAATDDVTIVPGPNTYLMPQTFKTVRDDPFLLLED